MVLADGAEPVCTFASVSAVSPAGGVDASAPVELQSTQCVLHCRHLGFGDGWQPECGMNEPGGIGSVVVTE